jgi:hypothetical protein
VGTLLVAVATEPHSSVHAVDPAHMLAAAACVCQVSLQSVGSGTGASRLCMTCLQFCCCPGCCVTVCFESVACAWYHNLCFRHAHLCEGAALAHM